VDIAFVAMSLVVGFTISRPAAVTLGLFTFLIYVIGAIVLVAIWRRSVSLFETNKKLGTIVLAVVNYALAIYALNVAIGLVTQSPANGPTHKSALLSWTVRT
jgi:hypothetical protein